MYAVEFETKIENGLVAIPHQYREIYQSQARILILVEETAKKVALKKNYSVFFNELRNRHIPVAAEIDINQLMNEMNDGLC
jgi:hypothetical protein